MANHPRSSAPRAGVPASAPVDAQANSPGTPDAAPGSRPVQATEAGAPGSVKWSQERRLHFIEFRLQWAGRINRRDVTEFFKISVPQASTDIARYSELVPRNLQYDATSRTYVATPEFSPIFESTGPRQYLSHLLALERNVIDSGQTFLSFHPPIASIPLPSRTIEANTLVVILRAIEEQGMLEIHYQSIAREEKQARYISPHALGYDGVRWHVRAYCHLRNGFKDFVFGRILSAGQIQASEIDPMNDLEWHTNVDLILQPAPSLSTNQRKGVEIDYGMKDGTVTIRCRQAMLFYTLRTLNFEANGSPRKGESQIVIANLTDIGPLLPTPGQF